jgi:hypothetical protein
MSMAWDWCCGRCGGSGVAHFFGPDVRGRKRWQNRCLSCGRVSEYLPTRAEIEGECQVLRRQQGHIEINDEQEKLWREHEGQLTARSTEDGEGEW